MYKVSVSRCQTEGDTPGFPLDPLQSGSLLPISILSGIMAPVLFLEDLELWSGHWQLKGQNAAPTGWLVKKKKCGDISFSSPLIHHHVGCLDKVWVMVFTYSMCEAVMQG